MGADISTDTRLRNTKTLDRLVGTSTIQVNDPFWETELNELDFYMDEVDLEEVRLIIDKCCSKLVENCMISGNLRNMVIVLTCTLERLPSNLTELQDWPLNLLFLLRVFIQYIIANNFDHDKNFLFTFPPPDPHLRRQHLEYQQQQQQLRDIQRQKQQRQQARSMRTNSKTQHGRSYRHRERAVGNLYANSMHGVSTFESDNDYEDGLTDYSTTNTDAETSAFNTPLFRSPVRQLEAQREKEQEIGHESTDTGRIEQSQGSAAPAGPSGNHATNAGSDSNAYRTSHSTSAMTSVDVSNGGNGDCNDTDDKQSTAATTVTAPSTPPVPRRTRTSSFTFDLTKHHVDTNSTDSRIIVEPHSNLPGNTDDDDTVIDINNKAPTPTTIDPNIDTSFTFDTLYHNQSDHHHHHHQQYTHARVHNTNISSRLMKALMDAMIDIDLNDQTYELHHEIVNILLVLVSTQLYGPLSPAYHNIFLNIIIEGAPANRAAEFIQTLLFNFMGRLSDDSAGSAASSDTTSGPATSVPVRSKSSTRAISDAFTNNNNINFMHKYNSHQQNLNSNVITRWTSHLSSIIRFSLSIYHYFFPPPPVEHPLADRSALLMQILVHQRQSNLGLKGPNPYHMALTRFTDDQFDVPLVGSSMNQLSLYGGLLTPTTASFVSPPTPSNFHNSVHYNFYQQQNNLHSDGSSASSSNSLPSQQSQAVMPAHVLGLSFGTLYDAIGSALPQEWATLLLYSLLQSNSLFCEFIYAKSDLDVLVLPLLEVVYHQWEDLETNRIYVVLIIILILSQDASFGENVHKRLILKSVPWYKEVSLHNISLGSLMMVILFRTIQLNLSKIRDPYLHTNCLAALANMSPHSYNIHPYCAQRLMSLLYVLSKKYLRLVKTSDSMPIPHAYSSHDGEGQQTHSSAYAEENTHGMYEGAHTSYNDAAQGMADARNSQGVETYTHANEGNGNSSTSNDNDHASIHNSRHNNRQYHVQHHQHQHREQHGVPLEISPRITNTAAISISSSSSLFTSPPLGPTPARSLSSSSSSASSVAEASQHPSLTSSVSTLSQLSQLSHSSSTSSLNSQYNHTIATQLQANARLKIKQMEIELLKHGIEYNSPAKALRSTGHAKGSSRTGSKKGQDHGEPLPLRSSDSNIDASSHTINVDTGIGHGDSEGKSTASRGVSRSLTYGDRDQNTRQQETHHYHPDHHLGHQQQHPSVGARARLHTGDRKECGNDSSAYNKTDIDISDCNSNNDTTHVNSTYASGGSSGEVFEGEEEAEEASYQTATFGEFIRLVLEIAKACLSKNTLANNVHLIYCLVHRKELLIPFQHHDRFWDLVEYLMAIIDYFEGCIDRANLPPERRSVQMVIRIIEGEARTYQSHMVPGNMAQAKFRYEEQENSEEFFLPYIWEVIHQLGLIPWLEPAVEEEDQDGGENDSGTGTGTGSSNGNSTASDDCPQQQLVSPHSYNAHPDNSTSASITKNNSVNDHYELKSHSKYSNNMNRNSRSSSSSSSSSGEDDRTSLGSNRASYDARLQAYTTDQHHSTSTLTRSHPLSPSSSSASAAGLAPSAAPPATASSLPTTRPDSDDAITISIDADIVTAPKINTDDSNAKGECNDTSNGNTIQTSTDAPPSILSYPFEFITGHANNLINLL